MSLPHERYPHGYCDYEFNVYNKPWCFEDESDSEDTTYCYCNDDADDCYCVHDRPCLEDDDQN